MGKLSNQGPMQNGKAHVVVRWREFLIDFWKANEGESLAGGTHLVINEFFNSLVGNIPFPLQDLSFFGFTGHLQPKSF